MSVDTNDITVEEVRVLNIAERLKETLCNTIDNMAQTLVEQSQKERQYTEDVERLQRLLSHENGGYNLSIDERVLLIIKKNRELEAKIKQTDDLLLAKKHYLPLIQHILKCSQDRNDQAMINTVNEFLISGRLI